MRLLTVTAVLALVPCCDAPAASYDANQQLCQSVGRMAGQIVLQRDHGVTFSTAKKRLDIATRDVGDADTTKAIKSLGERILVTAYKTSPHIKPEQAAKMYFFVCMNNLNG